MKFFFTRKNKVTYLAAVLSLLLSFSAFSQSASSPYSRYGLGSLEPAGFATLASMGGSFSAFQNDTLIPLFINQGNPASYSTNRLTTFEFGARGSFTNYLDNSGSVKKRTMGFNYIALAFPIKKNMGACFGLMPFSNVGYNSSNSSSTDSIGSVTYNYQGTGGLNQVFGGYAIRPFDRALRKYMRGYKTLIDSGEYKKARNGKFWNQAFSSLSLGCNASFLYGTIDYTSYAYFPYNYGSVFNTKRYTETNVHDIYLQLGAQMNFDIDSIGRRNLKNNLKITLGYTAYLPKSVYATASQYAYSFSSSTNGIEQPFDSTYSYMHQNLKGSIYIPVMHNAGIGLKIGDKVTILADAGFQQWSRYSFFGDNQKLKDSYRAGFGIQYLPQRSAIGSWAYIKRISYRAGARYNSGYLVLNGKTISDYAVTAGIGLPVGKYKLLTIVNLSGEYGISGTTQNSLIQQKYFRFVIGLTFNDRWFIKRQYD